MADEPDAGPSGGSGLSRQVGPFTVGVWGAIIVSGAVAGYFIRRSGLFTSAPATAVDSSTIPNATTGWVATGGPLAGSGTTTSTDAGTPLASNDPRTATTNLLWQKLVGDQLIAGGQDPALVSSALTDYIGGYPLSTQERSIIDMALRIAGQPPESAPPITLLPPPSPTTVPSGDVSTPLPVLDSGTPATPATTATPQQIQLLKDNYAQVVGKLSGSNPGDIATLANQAAFFKIHTGDDGPIPHTPNGNRNAYFLALAYKQTGHDDLITPRT